MFSKKTIKKSNRTHWVNDAFTLMAPSFNVQLQSHVCYRLKNLPKILDIGISSFASFDKVVFVVGGHQQMITFWKDFSHLSRHKWNIFWKFIDSKNGNRTFSLFQDTFHLYPFAFFPQSAKSLVHELVFFFNDEKQKERFLQNNPTPPQCRVPLNAKDILLKSTSVPFLCKIRCRNLTFKDVLWSQTVMIRIPKGNPDLVFYHEKEPLYRSRDENGNQVHSIFPLQRKGKFPIEKIDKDDRFSIKPEKDVELDYFEVFNMNFHRYDNDLLGQTYYM
jgi:hypothetical protein